MRQEVTGGPRTAQIQSSPAAGWETEALLSSEKSDCFEEKGRQQGTCAVATKSPGGVGGGPHGGWGDARRETGDCESFGGTHTVTEFGGELSWLD